nr:hypothetical protein [Tanacetum cinerariifolium]
MSEASSAVTYTSVYTDSEPRRVFWGVDEELSDRGYVAESDPEEDPEEYEEDEAEDGPVDYPKDGGDDGDDDDDGNLLGYDADDEDEDNEDEEEEEKHLAPADSAIVITIDELIDLAEAVPVMAPTTLEKVNTRVTKLVELHEYDTQDLYALLEDTQDSRTHISQRVSMDSQRVDLLMGDRMTLQETVWIVEEEAYAAREAWAQSIGLSQTVNHELQNLRKQVQIMAPVTRQGHNLPPPNTNTPPHHMTPESMQAMINQALLRNSTNGDGSQSSHKDNPRHVQTTRHCFYADFMKCHPLKFKGNEGVVGLTRWIEKMESVFNISGCAIENQVKFATCTLLDAALTWWNSQIRTLGLEFVANETEKIDKYISGLPDNIYGNGRERGNHMKDLCPSAQNANVITMARVLRSATSATSKETPKGNGCFECGASGHFKRDHPKPKNKNRGNRNAQGWVYTVRNAEKNGNAPVNPDSNVITGKFLLNNHYASILFDTGADRSFISVAFSSLVNIDPTPLGSSYDVELADGKIVGKDTIIRGCTIIGMDWVRRCHTVIVCDEKLVQIPYGNETLTFRGNESNNGRKSRLAVISCSKAQGYMAKGCQIFMAHISTKKEEDKSEGKQLKDVPIVWDFPEVFPEDFPGLPPARPVV